MHLHLILTIYTTSSKNITQNHPCMLEFFGGSPELPRIYVFNAIKKIVK